MALVDERGRLFGRLNLFDALVLVLVFGMIPLAYAGYLIFRAPLPKLLAVDPPQIVDGPNLRVTIRGAHLRPYMRVSFGSIQGQTFLFKDTTEALVDLTQVPPGVYDVVLYDFAQERGRLPKGLTIHPSPLPDATMTVVGTLGNVKLEDAGKIVAGTKIPEVGEIVQVGKPQPQVTRVYARLATVEVPIANAHVLPVVVRVSCYVRAAQGAPECAGGSVALQPTAMLFVNTPIGRVPLQIDQVRGAQPLVPMSVSVRFSGAPEALAMVRAGDVDYGEFHNELGMNARVVSVDGGGAARLELDAQEGTSSWLYRNNPLRVGAAFAMRTDKYELQGTVTSVHRRDGK